ncbi:MAG TPA: class I SAM-dependent methyltransferase, partial [Acidimicrobiales bacterium]|nr:class I SAM-dependent methyltransferase [Acidimicrobiales bacterium]
EAQLTHRQLIAVLSARGEVVVDALGAALELHLFALHHARVALMAAVLPPGRRIVDLGGANAPLYESGYPYEFDELIMVDLPPADRHEEFAGRIHESKHTPQGKVAMLYTDMADLSAIEDASVDLVWSGESIEHISRDHARAVYDEVRRILRPDGAFCLDTPNALVTRIHSPDALIHPDHKIEYTPAELVADLHAGGFDVTRSYGVCEMPLTVAAGHIDYRDFLVGAGLSAELDRCYIQYHECRLHGAHSRSVPPAAHGADPHRPLARARGTLNRLRRRLK